MYKRENGHRPITDSFASMEATIRGGARRPQHVPAVAPRSFCTVPMELALWFEISKSWLGKQNTSCYMQNISKKSIDSLPVYGAMLVQICVIEPQLTAGWQSSNA